MSTRKLFTGIPLDATKDTKFQFMETIQAHVDDTNNSMDPRAVDAVYLRPTGTLTGGFWAYDINTCQRIYRMNATPTSLTTTMRNRIEEIGRTQQMPNRIMFGNSKGATTILDIETTANTDKDDASDTSYNDKDADVASVETTLMGVINKEIAIENHTIM